MDSTGEFIEMAEVNVSSGLQVVSYAISAEIYWNQMIQIMDNLLYKCTLSNMANGCSKYSMLDEEKLRDGHSVNCSFDDMSLMMTRQLQCVIHGVRFEEVEGHFDFVIDFHFQTGLCLQITRD